MLIVAVVIIQDAINVRIILLMVKYEKSDLANFVQYMRGQSLREK